MSDSDEDEAEELEDFYDPLFDISDVKWDLKPNKRRREVVLIARASESDFNLMKYCLALRAYLDQMETEIGIMAESGREH